jgi:hypothetical protein
VVGYLNRVRNRSTAAAAALKAANMKVRTLELEKEVSWMTMKGFKQDFF